MRIVFAFIHVEYHDWLARVRLFELEVDRVDLLVRRTIEEVDDAFIGNGYVAVFEAYALGVLEILVLYDHFEVVMELLLISSETIFALLVRYDHATIIRGKEGATLHEIEYQVLHLWLKMIIVIYLQAVDVVEICNEKLVARARVVQLPLLTKGMQLLPLAMAPNLRQFMLAHDHDLLEDHEAVRVLRNDDAVLVENRLAQRLSIDRIDFRLIVKIHKELHCHALAVEAVHFLLGLVEEGLDWEVFVGAVL